MSAAFGVLALLLLLVSLGVGSHFVWQNVPHRIWRWIPAALTLGYVAASLLAPAPATRALLHNEAYAGAEALRGSLPVLAYVIILYWLIWLVQRNRESK